MLTYDLQRYHPAFAVHVVDQVLEDIRRGLEQNLFKFNQHRVASVKYLGELYIYRLVGSNVIFDTLWALVTFGHRESVLVPISLILRLVTQFSPSQRMDVLYRIRLV